jgi:hypothetical protein
MEISVGAGAATGLAACDPLVALAAATTREGNNIRGKVGFWRYLNFRVFQRYRRQVDISLGSAAPLAMLLDRQRCPRLILTHQARVADDIIALIAAWWRAAIIAPGPRPYACRRDCARTGSDRFDQRSTHHRQPGHG